AIVLALLKRGEVVVGIGRSYSINHPNFQFVHCDLSDTAAIRSLEFPEHAEEVTLINNAGILGEIGRISELKESDMETVLAVNTVAPMLLTQKIYASLSNKNKFCLVNISSGAANRAIPSWAAYCASKAALNMWTEGFYREELELGRKLKVYAVAPGVIDTDMQTEIRKVPENQFSAVQNFIELKRNDQLFTPEHAAKLLLQLLDLPFAGEVICDLRAL
ncbi:MAG: hypothetical protein A3D92_08210, partial [Bacteroidetes bacterium RIFCSPHIGHO2_02_FULL_44_7]